MLINKLLLKILTISLLITCCLSLQINGGKDSINHNNNNNNNNKQHDKKSIVEFKKVENNVDDDKVTFCSSGCDDLIIENNTFNTTLLSVNQTLSFINSTLGNINSTLSFNGTVYFNGTESLNATALNSTIHNIQDTLYSIRLALESLNATLVHMNETLTTTLFNETSLNTSIPYYSFQPYWDDKCLFPGGSLGVAINKNQQNITIFNETAICANFNLTSNLNFSVQYFADNNCTFANQSIHNETFVINECTYSEFMKAYYFIDLTTVKLPPATMVVNYFNKSRCQDINQEGFNYMNNHTVVAHPSKRPHIASSSILFCNELNQPMNQTCTTSFNKQTCTSKPIENTCGDELRNYRITCVA